MGCLLAFPGVNASPVPMGFPHFPSPNAREGGPGGSCAPPDVQADGGVRTGSCRVLRRVTAVAGTKRPCALSPASEACRVYSPLPRHVRLQVEEAVPVPAMIRKAQG